MRVAHQTTSDGSARARRRAVAPLLPLILTFVPLEQVIEHLIKSLL